MITHITYKEAQFKGTAAANAAIARAEEHGWSVSDRRYAGGHVVVTFRIDQDYSGGRVVEHLELPDFDFGKEYSERRNVVSEGFRRVFGMAAGLRTRKPRQHRDVRHHVRRVG